MLRCPGAASWTGSTTGLGELPLEQQTETPQSGITQGGIVTWTQCHMEAKTKKCKEPGTEAARHAPRKPREVAVRDN